MAISNILALCVQLQYGTVLASFNLFLCRTIPNAEHSCVGHFTGLLLNVRAFYCRMLDVSTSMVHINPALPFHHTLYTYLCMCKGALTNYVCSIRRKGDWYSKPLHFLHCIEYCTEMLLGNTFEFERPNSTFILCVACVWLLSYIQDYPFPEVSWNITRVSTIMQYIQ